jgi:hypothetical protein
VVPGRLASRGGYVSVSRFSGETVLNAAGKTAGEGGAVADGGGTTSSPLVDNDAWCRHASKEGLIRFPDENP